MKNKAQPPLEKGNPSFNLNDVASAAVLPEDLALEAELARMDTMPMPDIEPEPIGAVVKKEKETLSLLSEVQEGIKPASTEQELRDQVYQAKMEGCDSIEATLQTARRFCRDPLLEKVGYFIFHDIKVYVEGKVQASRERDAKRILI